MKISVKSQIFIGLNQRWNVCVSFFFFERIDELNMMVIGYFESLSDALEVKMRTTSVNDKITYAAEVQSMLRQLLTEVSLLTLFFRLGICNI